MTPTTTTLPEVGSRVRLARPDGGRSRYANQTGTVTRAVAPEPGRRSVVWVRFDGVNFNLLKLLSELDPA